MSENLTTWEFACGGKTDARYIHQSIPIPISLKGRWVRGESEIVDQVWQGVTPRTKVIYLSYITSSTALRLPVEQICQRARQAGILTVIDGAHAMGQVPLDLQTLGADFYTSNCHKWSMMSA